MMHLIHIEDLVSHVRLGVTKEERSTLNAVKWNIVIKLLDIPVACMSDNIEETICYDSICKTVDSISSDGEYKLIERLCFRVFQSLKEKINVSHELSVKISKTSVPIHNLSGGASFVLEDI